MRVHVLLRLLACAGVFALFVGYFLVTNYTSLGGGRYGTTVLQSLTCPGSRAHEKQVIVLGSLSAEHTTVVSSYFDLSNNSTKSHPNWQFLEWLGRFLRSCKAPIVMFTDTRTVDFMRSIRANLTYKTTFIVYDTIWSLMRELEVKRNRSYRFNYEHIQPNWSLPELYAIWNLKAYTTKRAVDMNLYKSQFFIYNDAGAWRDWQTKDWPDNDFVKLVQARIGDRMLFGQLRANDPTWHCWFTVIEGGFFAGTAHAITKFEAVYYEFHDNMTVSNATDHFLGDDQCFLTRVCYGENNDYVSRPMNTTRIRLWGINETDTNCGNLWFFYQRFFSQAQYYACPHDRLKLIIEGNND